MLIEGVVDIRSRIVFLVRPFSQKSLVHSEAVLIPYRFPENHREELPRLVLPPNHLTSIE